MKLFFYRSGLLFWLSIVSLYCIGQSPGFLGKRGLIGINTCEFGWGKIFNMHLGAVLSENVITELTYTKFNRTNGFDIPEGVDDWDVSQNNYQDELAYSGKYKYNGYSWQMSLDIFDADYGLSAPAGLYFGYSFERTKGNYAETLDFPVPEVINYKYTGHGMKLSMGNGIFLYKYLLLRYGFDLGYRYGKYKNATLTEEFNYFLRPYHLNAPFNSDLLTEVFSGNDRKRSYIKIIILPVIKTSWMF